MVERDGLSADAPRPATAGVAGRRAEREGGAAAERSRRSRFPTRQPARTVVLCATYTAVVVSAFLVLGQLYRPELAILFATGLAAMLIVPFAVLVPAPRAPGEERDDVRPVLQRSRSTSTGSPERSRPRPAAPPSPAQSGADRGASAHGGYPAG